MKKKLFLKKETIASLNNNAMNDIKGGKATLVYPCYVNTDLCGYSEEISCDTNGCAYQTIDEPTCEDPTFTAQGGPLCAPGCFPV